MKKKPKPDYKPDTSTFKPYKPNPLLVGLPEYLKDHANYPKIRKFLYDIVGSRCGHSDPAAWYTCSKCYNRMQEYKMALEKLGFKSSKQYYLWRRIHEMMDSKQRDPLTYDKR